MIRRILLTLTPLLFIAGCESTPPLNDISANDLKSEFSTLGLRNNTPIPKEAEKLLDQSTPCCKDFAEIPYYDLKLDSTFPLVMDGSYPTYKFSDGKSFFAAFRLPRSNRPLSIEIQSIASLDRVFAPTIAILNSNFQITRQYGEAAFEYKTAGFLKGERLEANLEDIGGFKDEAYLIVYTSEGRRAGSTQLIHPSKQFARTQNRVEPDIPDPIAKHSALGVVAVYATTGTPSDKTREPLVIPKDQEIAPEIYVDQKIKQAVAEGRIEDAMILVEDAEANGSTTARRTFIEAVKGKQQQ